MELIQPFINAADAVLAETLLEGRVVLDTDVPTATAIASALIGSPVEENDPSVKEAIFELANLVIGNAVTSLNDQGFRFKINPPEPHTEDKGLEGTEDTEALVMSFDTPSGSVFMNIAMRYNRRRRQEREAVVSG
ncbi:MAG: chemotaxis protein CheX [Acidobacteriales bacterium]|nr:chemotaxis protein CheX [Terriglobales bacterium]